MPLACTGSGRPAHQQAWQAAHELPALCLTASYAQSKLDRCLHQNIPLPAAAPSCCCWTGKAFSARGCSGLNSRSGKGSWVLGSMVPAQATPTLSQYDWHSLRACYCSRSSYLQQSGDTGYLAARGPGSPGLPAAACHLSQWQLVAGRRSPGPAGAGAAGAPWPASTASCCAALECIVGLPSRGTPFSGATGRVTENSRRCGCCDPYLCRWVVHALMVEGPDAALEGCLKGLGHAGAAQAQAFAHLQLQATLGGQGRCQGGHC